MNNKRGLSTLIVIVILLSLVLGAIVGVWAVVRGIVTESTEDASFKEFSINLDLQSASVIGDDANVVVKRNPGKGELKGIRFIFYDGTKSKTIDDPNTLGELEEKKFTFSLSNDLVMSSLERVSIVPLYTVDGKETAGRVADVYSFVQAGSGGTGGPGNGGGAVCGNGQCETTSGENPTTCPQDCGAQSCTPAVTCTTLQYSCGSAVDDCGNDLNCGSCNAGEVCIDHECLVDLLLSGTVDSVWPGSAPRYFDSSQLPIDGTEGTLVSNYVSFNDQAGIGCIQILNIEHVYDPGPPVYDKSHVQLERVVTMVSGNSFKIWRSSNCGGLV